MADKYEIASDNAETPPEKEQVKRVLSCQDRVVSDCCLEIDIILESSNGVQFGTHRYNLEIYSEGFPLGIFKSGGVPEIVKMEEDDTVVVLLLRYMHLCPQPDSTEFSFELLERLAHAAEKYMIYSAMGVCRLRMEFYLHQHPMAVFGYAVKHNCRPLANKAAQSTLKYTLKAIEICLDGNMEVARRWLQYREGWNELLKWVHVREPPFVPHKNSSCARWSLFHKSVLGSMDMLTFDPGNLSNFKEIVSRHRPHLEGCRKCSTRATGWCSDVDTKRSQLPIFSTFL